MVNGLRDAGSVCSQGVRSTASTPVCGDCQAGFMGLASGGQGYGVAGNCLVHIPCRGAAGCVETQ